VLALAVFPVHNIPLPERMQSVLTLV
jgi:hypothetical protein